jgi:MraZ protein
MVESGEKGSKVVARRLYPGGGGACFLARTNPNWMKRVGSSFLPASAMSSPVVWLLPKAKSLYVFPAAEFTSITQRLRQAPVTEKSSRDYMRVMFAGAHDEIPDKQGRVTIPSGLRIYAGLEKECVVIGANTRLEIWDATAWNTYLADRENSFSDVSSEVLPGLF